MDVSIIIINYNTKELTLNCIKSIIDKTKDINYEIILVDNNSTDGSKELFSSLDNIAYHYLDVNIGFGRANNYGVKYSKGKYIFFLNPDTILMNNAIKILYETINNKKEVGAVGGNLYQENNIPTISFFRIFPSFKSEFNSYLGNVFLKLRYGKSINFNYSKKIINVKYIIGADLMMSKYLFEDLGGFDPSYFMYYEETDLEYRIHKKGFKILNNPNAKIYHFEGKSTKFKLNRYILQYKSRKLFFLKNRGNFYYITINYLYIFILYLKLLYYKLKRNKEKIFEYSERIKVLKNI